MPDMRSVGRMLRLRAERGATRDELEAELENDVIISGVDRSSPRGIRLGARQGPRAGARDGE